MKNLVVVKLGGSVITDKSKNKPVFRKSVARRLALEIKSAKGKKDLKIIIVHGAGSFGHPIAKKYKLNEGYLNSKTLEGVSLCRQSMARLKLLVLDELIGVNLDADLVDTSSVAQTNGGKLTILSLEKITELLKLGSMPVLSGDVVFDSKKGVSILSGDQIAPYLADKMGGKIVYVSDVDGVFDKNPQKYKNAKLVKKINKNNYINVIRVFENSGRADVTGEMQYKIETILGYRGMQARIISGFKVGSLTRVLLGESLGTYIKS